MLPADDSGHHLHPNDAGMQGMANAIPLSLFRKNGFAQFRKLSCSCAEYLQDFCSRATSDNSDIDRLTAVGFDSPADRTPEQGVIARQPYVAAESRISRKGNTMHLKKLALVLALSAGAAAVFGPANAESGKIGTPGRHMKALDTDSDGTIDLNEAKKAASAHFKRLDKDSDNTLDTKEMSRLGLDKKAFSTADPDNDKTIDNEEYLAIVEQRFKAADTDNDGTLSSKEMNSKAGKALMRLVAK